MPLKLNISMSRKVGEANYGSRGAAVGLELEVDSNLVDHPKQLHEQISRLFRLAKHSVDLELDGPQRTGREPRVRNSTPAQVRAIHAIANRQELELSDELRRRFNVGWPEELSLQQASEFIDAIKPTANGAAAHS